MNGVGVGFLGWYLEYVFCYCLFYCLFVLSGMLLGCIYIVNVVCCLGGWWCLGRDKYCFLVGYGGNLWLVNWYNVRYKGGWWIYFFSGRI